MKLTRNQKSIIVGTILGDGFLQKTGAKNARLRLEHSNKQKDYLVWKMQSLPRLFQGKPVHLSRVHPKTKRTYHYVRAQSNTSPEIGKLREVFYQDGKKTIPQDIEKYLDELALAVWYMDDGYYYKRDKNSFIYLGKMNKDKAKIVSDAIKNKFNITTKVYDKKNKGLVLYFPVAETKKLHKIIRQYVIPLFSYKLG
ncbi:MAG: hypothetical protein ACE5H1_02590 [Thermodesulfobacteriota bacterium]